MVTWKTLHVLVDYVGNKRVYVKSYNPKTMELETTENVLEARNYRSKAGAISSANSLYFKMFLGNRTEHVFDHVEYRVQVEG